MKYHLTPDQIIMSIVDEAELLPELRSHLESCSRCTNEKIKIERRLSELSRMAKQMAPEPTRRIRLPETKYRSYFWSGRRFGVALGVAMVFVLILIVVWHPGKYTTRPDLGRDMAVRETKKDDQLLTEIGILVKNALPEAYQNILDSGEPEFEGDFMQYIVPPVENKEPRSLSYRERGILKC